MEEQKQEVKGETKVCKHCQSEIPKKAKICPVCRKKQKKGIVKWIIIVIVVLGVFSVLMSGGGDSDEPSNKNPKKVGNTEQGGTDDGIGQKEESKDFSVGDVVETSNLKITYLSAKKYKSDNEYTKPKKGNVFYEMQFEFENTSDSDEYVSSSYFKCYADGYDMEQQYFDGFELDATLSSGKKTKGSVFFEMPKDAKEVTLEYECNFWTEDKIVFKVK